MAFGFGKTEEEIDRETFPSLQPGFAGYDENGKPRQSGGVGAIKSSVPAPPKTPSPETFGKTSPLMGGGGNKFVSPISPNQDTRETFTENIRNLSGGRMMNPQYSGNPSNVGKPYAGAGFGDRKRADVAAFRKQVGLPESPNIDYPNANGNTWAEDLGVDKTIPAIGNRFSQVGGLGGIAKSALTDVGNRIGGSARVGIGVAKQFAGLGQGLVTGNINRPMLREGMSDVTSGTSRMYQGIFSPSAIDTTAKGVVRDVMAGQGGGSQGAPTQQGTVPPQRGTWSPSERGFNPNPKSYDMSTYRGQNEASGRQQYGGDPNSAMNQFATSVPMSFSNYAGGGGMGRRGDFYNPNSPRNQEADRINAAIDERVANYQDTPRQRTMPAGMPSASYSETMRETGPESGRDEGQFQRASAYSDAISKQLNSGSGGFVNARNRARMQNELDQVAMRNQGAMDVARMNEGGEMARAGMQTATQRRGQDLQAQTSREGNMIDQQRVDNEAANMAARMGLDANKLTAEQWDSLRRDATDRYKAELGLVGTRVAAQGGIDRAGISAGGRTDARQKAGQEAMKRYAEDTYGMENPPSKEEYLRQELAAWDANFGAESTSGQQKPQLPSGWTEDEDGFYVDPNGKKWNPNARKVQ